jgi:general stress protein 26
MEIDYGGLLEEAVETISRQRIWVLATAAAEHVSARSMSIVNRGLTIYFQTHSSYLKCRQIEQNPNVALCHGNVQIEGDASIRGNINCGENDFFSELYSEEHPGSYKTYSGLEGQVVIEVRPRLIVFWKYIENIPYKDILDLVSSTAAREEQFHME